MHCSVFITEPLATDQELIQSISGDDCVPRFPLVISRSAAESGAALTAASACDDAAQTVLAEAGGPWRVELPAVLSQLHRQFCARISADYRRERRLCASPGEAVVAEAQREELAAVH